jgi:hypothetical protein
MIVDTNALFGLKTEHLQEHSDGFFINTEVEAPFKALQAAAHEAGFNLKPASLSANWRFGMASFVASGRY